MVNVFYNLKAFMLQKCKELLPDKLERMLLNGALWWGLAQPTTETTACIIPYSLDNLISWE